MKLTYTERKLAGFLSHSVGDVVIDCSDGETLTEAQATVVLLDRIAQLLERVDNNTG